MREDVYGVFVRVQDEQHALTADYAKFAQTIHESIREQLARRDKIDTHLAQKARLYNKGFRDAENLPDCFEKACEQLKTSYAQHKKQTLKNIGQLVKKQTQEAPYDAFILGLAMYVACYLVNAPLDEADNNVVNLVQEAFCKALHCKIKQSYPSQVKQLKFSLKFIKVKRNILQ